MRNFIDELRYMCSSSNTKSRGLYILITIMLIVMPLGAIAGLVGFFICLAASNFVALPLIISIVLIIIEVALILWLVKS